jgi:hypothetical protein
LYSLLYANIDVVVNNLRDKAAPHAFFAVKRALEWSKKYFEQRRVSFSESSAEDPFLTLGGASYSQKGTSLGIRVWKKLPSMALSNDLSGVFSADYGNSWSFKSVHLPGTLGLEEIARFSVIW